MTYTGPRVENALPRPRVPQGSAFGEKEVIMSAPSKSASSYLTDAGLEGRRS